jgi:hypothetical protein
MQLPAALIALALATPTSAFVARNDLVIEPVTATEFTIPYRGLSGAPDFWCAAGDYVIQRLHLLPTTRIYRLSPPPRRSGEGIRFSLRPDGAAASGLAVFGSPDRGISAATAQALCQPWQRPFFD